MTCTVMYKMGEVGALHINKQFWVSIEMAIVLEIGILWKISKPITLDQQRLRDRK